MKKIYRLDHLGCANCAAKMQAQILKLDGVISAKVNFMLAKLTVEAEDALMPTKAELQRIISSIEPECVIL